MKWQLSFKTPPSLKAPFSLSPGKGKKAKKTKTDTDQTHGHPVVYRLIHY